MKAMKQPRKIKTPGFILSFLQKMYLVIIVVILVVVVFLLLLLRYFVQNVEVPKVLDECHESKDQ